MRTDLNGIEEGGHSRWQDILLFECKWRTTARSFPIWEGDLALLRALPFELMPHADSALLPEGIKTRQQFWDHVYEQLIHLLAGQRVWVCRSLHTVSF